MKEAIIRHYIAFVLFLAVISLPLLGWQQAMAAEGLPASKHVTSELFLDISHVGQRLVAVGQRGHILFSDDDGEQWWQASVPTARLLTAVTFTSAGIGWAVGHDAIILKSEDKGQTWFGVHGALTTSKPSDDPLFDVHFIDQHIGYAVGGFGLVLLTRDGGKTWQSVGESLPNEDGMHLNNITSDGKGNAYIAGEAGLFLHSADNGESWRVVEFPYAGTLNGVISMTDGTVVAYGLRGNIFMGEASASQWQPLTMNQQNTLYGATLSTSGKLIVVGEDGVIISNHNNQWQMRNHERRLAISSAIVVNDHLLIVVGMTGINRVFTDEKQPTTKSEAES